MKITLTEIDALIDAVLRYDDAVDTLGGSESTDRASRNVHARLEVFRRISAEMKHRLTVDVSMPTSSANG